MLLKIHPDNPGDRAINQVVECLKNGGVIIFPTDTVYALGCDIHQHKAVEKLCRIKGIKLEKANFSFICFDLSHISDFTQQFDREVYKLMKRNLPGPFTFILNANNNVPNLFKFKKKTIGIRVPDNNIAREIVKVSGNPIMSTSLHNDDIFEYHTDPELIFEEYGNLVDMVIDGGIGGTEASTIIDCTVLPPIVIRQGKGVID
jgi:tRNA threonylcarbamoyl adenosine modification protein (Sua5/YciO/YrdC/YwlC family)